jgi:hypothetical protein
MTESHGTILLTFEDVLKEFVRNGMAGAFEVSALFLTITINVFKPPLYWSY